MVEFKDSDSSTQDEKENSALSAEQLQSSQNSADGDQKKEANLLHPLNDNPTQQQPQGFHFDETASNEHRVIEEEDDDEDAVVRSLDDHKMRWKSRRWLALTIFAAKISKWTLEFAIAILLAEISNFQSILLVSTYGITSQVMVICFTPLVGRWMDDMTHNHGRRLTVVNRFIGCRDASVVMATLICFLVVMRFPIMEDKRSASTTTEDPNNYNTSTSIDADGGGSDGSATSSDHATVFFWLGIVLIHLLGAFAEMMHQSFLVAIGRDWVVLLSDGMGTDFLASLNVILAQVHLACRVVAPTVAGWILSGRFGILWIGSLSGIAMMVQWTAMTKIDNMMMMTTSSSSADSAPNLDYTENGDEHRSDSNNPPNDGENLSITASNDEVVAPPSTHNTSTFSTFVASLRVYIRQPMAWVGLGYALLYSNALTFSGMMVAYLVSQGMAVTTAGAWSGASNLVGLFATCIYHQSVKYSSVAFTGMWSIAFDVFCLTVAFGSIFSVGNNTQLSLALLIGGVVCSRMGLWVNDMAVTQLFQESIPARIRGQIGGFQTSINAVFELVPFALGMVFHKTEQFSILIASGYGSIILSMTCYLLGFYISTKGNSHHLRFQVVETKETLTDVELTYNSVV